MKADPVRFAAERYFARDTTKWVFPRGCFI